MPLRPYTSVIIPVYNEQQDVAELARSLEAVLQPSDEIIFVDDGSTDETWRNLRSLHNPGRIRLLRFRKNFGKTAALKTGFSESRGEILITMDGDLQDDPKEIPRFLQKLDEGYDLVVGWKKERRDPRGKVISSHLFNLVVRAVTGVKLHDVNCGFKAYRADVAKAVRIYGDLHRFIPVLVASQGFRVTEIEVTHHPRRHGHSKYGFSRVFSGFFDLITVSLLTRFGERPSHGFGYAALVLLGAGFVMGVLRLLLDTRLPLNLLVAILCIGGITLFAAGWVGEIIIAECGRCAGIPPHWIEERLD